jgi:hypothetical protein
MFLLPIDVDLGRVPGTTGSAEVDTYLLVSASVRGEGSVRSCVRANCRRLRRDAFWSSSAAAAAADE